LDRSCHIIHLSGEVVISMRPVSVFANGPGSGIEQLEADLRGRWRQATRAVMVLLSLQGWLPPTWFSGPSQLITRTGRPPANPDRRTIPTKAPCPAARHDPLPGDRAKGACGAAARALRAPMTRPPGSQNPAAIRDRDRIQPSPEQATMTVKRQKSNPCYHKRMQVRRISRGGRGQRSSRSATGVPGGSEPSRFSRLAVGSSLDAAASEIDRYVV
jgi:hypothetical protein